MLTKWITFFKAHETLLILALFLGTGIYGYDKYLNYADRRATASDNAARTAAAQKQAVTAAQVQAYAALIAQISAQNAAIMKAISARDAATKQQQATDATIPLPALAERWATLGGFNTTLLTPTATGITATDAAARATVQVLEQVPTLQADLRDETALYTNQTNLLASCNATVGDQKTEIAKNDAACVADKKKLTADARKSKLKWFFTGLAIGFAGGRVHTW